MGIHWRRLRGSIIVTALTLLAVGAAGLPARATPPAPFDWFDATLRLPWTAARLPDGTLCPGGVIRFHVHSDDARGIAVRRGLLYSIRTVSEADVTGDGRPDTVVALFCGRAGADPGSFSEPASEWFFVYSVLAGRPVARGYLTSSYEAANPLWFVFDAIARRGAVDVTQGTQTPTGLLTVPRTFRWTGHRFVPDRPLPYHPEADGHP